MRLVEQEKSFYTEDPAYSFTLDNCLLGPELHDSNAGVLVPANRLAAALLDPNYERDGVSILGGEPFAQPDALLALILELRMRGCSHILCYSGYTYEALQE